MKKLSENVGNCQKVLFLGFNQEKTNLIDFLTRIFHRFVFWVEMAVAKR